MIKSRNKNNNSSRRRRKNNDWWKTILHNTNSLDSVTVPLNHNLSPNPVVLNFRPPQFIILPTCNFQFLFLTAKLSFTFEVFKMNALVLEVWEIVLNDLPFSFSCNKFSNWKERLFDTINWKIWLGRLGFLL